MIAFETMFQPSERVRVLSFENTQINLVFCSLIRNFAPDDESLKRLVAQHRVFIECNS